MKKPELIAYTYNLLGGSASFYKNLFNNNPDHFFDCKGIILEYDWNDQVPPIEDIRTNEKDEIRKVSFKDYLKRLYTISKGVSNKEGLIVCSDTNELEAFSLFKKKNKTIYFICHDDAYIKTCLHYEKIIDVFIAHNFSVYEDIIKLIPNRKNEIFYIPHGIDIVKPNRVKNEVDKLRIVFLARHHKNKGIYDLIIIDKLLKDKNIEVEWTILGKGPETENFKNSVSDNKKFTFKLPINQSEIYAILEKQDVFILPSILDGLPVSLLESMSLGCVPVISEFNKGISKVVTEKEGFVLEVGNNNSFVEKIMLLNQNRNLLNELSANCIEKIATNNNIKFQALKYFDLFKEYKKYWKKKEKLGVKDYEKVLLRVKPISKLLSIVFRIRNKILK